MTYGKGHSWESQSSPQLNIDKAVHVAREKTPAIVQSAVVKNNAYYEKALETADMMHLQERGRILKEWKESKTWKEKYDTWAQACAIALDITSRHADRLVAEFRDMNVSKAKQEADTLRKIKDLPDPTTPPPVGSMLIDYLDPEKMKQRAERQDPSEKPSVQAATPEQMKKVKEPEAAQEPTVWKDKVGNVIPATALEYWQRGQEVQANMTAISNVKCHIEQAAKTGDRLWSAHETQSLIVDLQAIYHRLTSYLPHAICCKCNGTENGKLCSLCHGTGLIGKDCYERNKGNYR